MKNLDLLLRKQIAGKKMENYGMYVTKDGGKTFKLSDYDNPNIEILTIEDIPYYDNKILKLPCSIYQIKENSSEYEDKKLIWANMEFRIILKSIPNFLFQIKDMKNYIFKYIVTIIDIIGVNTRTIKEILKF